MKAEEKLHQKYGHNAGYKVPEGYFDELYAKMHKNLPAYPEKPRVPNLSRWQRMKPYIYLAAMFVGIWCMMKVFSDITTRFNNIEHEVPENVILAVSDKSTGDYLMAVETENMSDDADLSLESEMCELYEDIDDFKADFDFVHQHDNS